MTDSVSHFKLPTSRLAVGGMAKMSLVDWPSKVAATVFIRGCNFRCPWCQNPDLVDPSRYRDPVPVDEVLTYLTRRRELLDGVVVTGGEAMLAPGLVAFLKQIRELGYPVKLDTNGSSPDLLARLLDNGLVERVAVDYKLPFEMYPRLVGGFSPEAVRKSIQLVLERGCGEVRTTVIPGLHTPQMLGEMIAAVPALRTGRYRLQPFRPGTCLDPQYDRLPETSEIYLKELAADLGLSR